MNPQKIAERLAEPSTWAAVAAALAAVLGADIVETAAWEPVVGAGVGVAGLAAFLLKERGSP